jgi:DNA-binding MarR family transcriptional regulator
MEDDFEGAFSPDRKKAWTLLLQAYKSVTEKIEAQIRAETGLTLTEFEILSRLQERHGRMRMADIANLLLVTPPRVSHLMSAMERKGYVDRTLFEGDRRGVFAVLTEKGRSTIVRARPVFFAAFSTWFADRLSDENISALNEAFTQLLGYVPEYPPADGNAGG